MVLWYQKKSRAHADAEGGAARRRAARDAGDRRAQPRGGLRRSGREARAARSLGEGGDEVARAARDEPARCSRASCKAGYKQTIKNLARKIGYKPQSPEFFGILGWKQKQADDGRRAIGLDNAEAREVGALRRAVRGGDLRDDRRRSSLRYKDAVGRLPKDIGLTPAIMVALLPTLSDRDLRQLTPTLEELGLLVGAGDPRAWEKAIASATDQRGLNIAKNVREQGRSRRSSRSRPTTPRARRSLRRRREADLRVMFLVDKSGSMQGAIESVEGRARARSSRASRSTSCTSRRSTRWARC